MVEFDPRVEERMMAQEPRCPKCHTTVQPSWDWCMDCGYDPAGRKPGDWTPSTPAPSPAPTIDLSDNAEPARPSAPASAPQPSGAWVAPAPPGAVRPAAAHGTRVTTLVGPDAARPQEMHDPDWVQQPTHRKLPIPALVGLLAVMAAAIVALIVVTLLVLHRPIGTTGGGALQARAVPPTTPALVRSR
jgi:hypothetical protein